MVATTKTQPANLKYRWAEAGFVQQTKTRNFILEYSNRSAKQNGTLIKFSDGSQFRKATNYSRFTSTVSPTSPQNIRGISLKYKPDGQKGYSLSSIGGYTGDDIHASSTAAVKVSGPAIRSAINYPTQPTGMRNEAVTKALNDLADSKAAVAENLATFSQTLRLIANPVGSLVKGLQQVKREKKFQPYLFESAQSLLRKGIVKKSAEEYLKYVYGWKPLMQDIHGLIEMAQGQSKGPLLLHSKGTSKLQSGLPDWTFTNGTHGHKLKFFNGNEQTVVRCNLWATPDGNHPGLRSLNQIGLINPLSLMWELVSWSFVIDWVLPIGPVLNALTASAGLTFVDGSIGTKSNGSAELENWHSDFDTGYALTQYQKATSKWTYAGYNRARLAAFPLPGIWVDSDPLRLKSTGSDRVFKALALAIVKLR